MVELPAVVVEPVTPEAVLLVLALLPPLAAAEVPLPAVELSDDEQLKAVAAVVTTRQAVNKCCRRELRNV